MAAYTHDVWARKYVQRVFCFADNGFVHIGIDPILRLTYYINAISKKWILEENAKKEWLNKVDKNGFPDNRFCGILLNCCSSNFQVFLRKIRVSWSFVKCVRSLEHIDSY